MINVEKAISIERTITKGKTPKRKTKTKNKNKKQKTKNKTKRSKTKQKLKQNKNKQTYKQTKTIQNKTKKQYESNPCISFIVTSFINAPTIWAKSPVISIAADLSICINIGIIVQDDYLYLYWFEQKKTKKPNQKKRKENKHKQTNKQTKENKTKYTCLMLDQPRSSA